MKKIDTTYWKSFLVSELFITDNNGKQVPTGANIPKLELKENGKTPRITVTAINNGVFGYFDYIGEKPSNYRLYSNFISVSFLGTVFYQAEEASLDMKVHCLKPINHELNKYTGEFLVAAIKASLINYKYSDQLSSSVLPKLEVSLPSKDESPDWQYMEDYMRRIEQRTKAAISAFVSSKHLPYRIDTAYWKEYRVGELFPNIKKPKVYHTREVKEDSSGIPYIVRSKFNNGIKYRIRPDDIELSPKGVITFGAENAAFFYQKEEWCGGRDIYYVDTRNIHPYACLFVAACLNRITDKYSYNFGLFPDLLKNERIKLPATPAGEPDWRYMEMYMRGVEAIAKNKLSLLAPHKPEVTIKEADTVNFTNANVTYIDKSTNYNIKK